MRIPGERRRPAPAAVVLAAACLAIVGCATSSSGQSGGAGGPQTPAAVSLIRDRCTVCHTLDRIKAASHDAGGWDTTVTRMREKGARVSDGEAKTIIEFLAGGGASGL